MNGVGEKEPQYRFRLGRDEDVDVFVFVNAKEWRRPNVARQTDVRVHVTRGVPAEPLQTLTPWCMRC
jgi:hypothetical protein